MSCIAGVTDNWVCSSPPPPDEAPVRRVLVGCTANLCRSPMAEGLIRSEAERQGFGHRLVVRSAGTWVDASRKPPIAVVQVMAEQGIDISQVRPREVSRELVEESDLVLVMTSSQREALEAEFPACRGKVRLMSALAGAQYDIADPFGGDIEDYRTTARELGRLIRAGWSVIAGEE